MNHIVKSGSLTKLLQGSKIQEWKTSIMVFSKISKVSKISKISFPKCMYWTFSIFLKFYKNLWPQISHLMTENAAITQYLCQYQWCRLQLNGKLSFSSSRRRACHTLRMFSCRLGTCWRPWGGGQWRRYTRVRQVKWPGWKIHRPIYMMIYH